MAIHSSIFAWKIPWREEPVGLQSIGSERVIHDRACTSSLLIKVWTGPATLALPGHLWKKWNHRPHTQFSSVAQSCPTLCDPHGLQHARPPCLSPTLRVYSNSCPSQWCHPTISSSVIPFSSCLQSFPASGSFQMSQFFARGGQSIGVSASASVLPMNTQDWFPLGWTGWISLQSQGPHTRPTVNK